MAQTSTRSSTRAMPLRKRLFDVVLVVAGAVVWVPVVSFVALAVLVRSGRPVFYRSQRRVSSHHVVRLTKFRTMVKNADQLVNRDTVPVEGSTRFLNIPPDSPLYTPVGRLVERFALTELPQLFHVLKGDMSVVGNRPLPQNVIDCLVEEFPKAGDRFLTAAGLTGPAQLVGREALTDEMRLELEAAYCRACLEHYRMRLDVVLLARTILGVLGVTKGLDAAGVHRLIEKHSRPGRLQPVAVVASAPERSGETPA